MKTETKHVETIVTDKYTFEVYREASNSWYANATTNDDSEFFYYKWTTGKTKKSVLLSIVGFVD